MRLLFKVFILQTLISAALAVPIYFYLRYDYEDFAAKQQIAQSVGPRIGALCTDGWHSGSTGRGTCSHHLGVKYWGSYLRHIAGTTWSVENLSFLILLGLGLVAWYSAGTRYIHRKSGEEMDSVVSEPKNCCAESTEKGFRYCYECGTEIGKELVESPMIWLPSVAYILLTTAFFVFVALSVFAVPYINLRWITNFQNADTQNENSSKRNETIQANRTPTVDISNTANSANATNSNASPVAKSPSNEPANSAPIVSDSSNSNSSQTDKIPVDANQCVIVGAGRVVQTHVDCDTKDCTEDETTLFGEIDDSTEIAKRRGKFVPAGGKYRYSWVPIEKDGIELWIASNKVFCPSDK